MTGFSWQPEKTIDLSISKPSFYDWMVDKGSFMQRLKAHGIEHAQIKVLSQEWQSSTLEETKLLGLTDRSPVLVREVIIESDENVWMFACTVFPKATLTGEEEALAHLKTRSLGSQLFADPSMHRSDFEIACFTTETDWYQKLKDVTLITAPTVWARRSIFRVKNKPLLLAEFFLPAMQKL